MKWLKIIGGVIGALVLLFVVVAGVAKAKMDASYFDGYDPSAPLDPGVVDIEEKAGEAGKDLGRPTYVRTHLYFNGYRDDRVPTLLATPIGNKDRLPCVVFLHGIGQSKGFLDRIAEPFVLAGFAFVSFDQLMQGERKLRDAPYLDQAKAFRARPAHTVNDTRRLIDYLETRDDIAPDRIYLTGASYGAITGATAAALDERIKAVVLCYGGGNVPKMLEARMVADEIRKRGPWMPVVKLIGWYLLSAADPLRYAGRIAPRPVFLQNGTDDGLIAADAARALQEAVREPKKIKIYRGDHIGFDEDTVRTVLADILEWLKEQDAKVVAAQPPVRPAA